MEKISTPQSPTSAEPGFDTPEHPTTPVIDIQACIKKLRKKANKRGVKIVQNVFADLNLRDLLTTCQIKEINSKNLYEHRSKLREALNESWLDLGKNRIYLLEDKVYISIRRCLVDPTLRFRLPSNTDAVDGENRKQALSKIVEEMNRDLDQRIFDKGKMLARHKELQKRLQSAKLEETERILDAPAQQLRKILEYSKIGFVMKTYGDFSIGSFSTKNGKDVFHTSDHKYVVRKKQGTRQSNKNKEKGKFSSVGGQIRSLNEKKHEENLASIFAQNKEQFTSCDLLLVYAAGDNILDLRKAMSQAKVSGLELRRMGVQATKAKYQEIVQAKIQIFKAALMFI